MKQLIDFPPNYKEITRFLKPEKETFYCYGDVIYNPSGVEIPPDIEYHEGIHAKQQKSFLSPALWWTKYLIDQDFRLDQELEAFTKQWMFIYKHIPKVKKESLEVISNILASPMYSIGKDRHQIETLIRLKAKKCPE